MLGQDGFQNFIKKYQDIPNFSPNKVDIGGFEPDGQFELADAVDYRPSVGQLFGNANFGSNSYVYDQTSILDLSDYGTNGNGAGILISPFAYEARSFEAIRENIDTNFDDSVDASADISSAKPSYSRCPLPTSMTKGNISFYVPRIDKVFLHRSGEWVVSPGNPGITPQKPNIVDDALEMFELFIRHSAGLGKSPNIRDPDIYDHRNIHCDVLVVGAGISGILAAKNAAKNNFKTLLVDEKNEIGGSTIFENNEFNKIDSKTPSEWLKKEID